jgi:hypothetical protein
MTRLEAHPETAETPRKHVETADGFDVRWAAWQARGRAQDERSNRAARVVVLAGVGCFLLFATRWVW